MSIEKAGDFTFNLDFDDEVDTLSDMTPTVRAMADAAESLPDGKLIPTLKLAAMTPFSTPTVKRQANDPALREYRVMIKHRIGWGNKVTVQRWREEHCHSGA